MSHAPRADRLLISSLWGGGQLPLRRWWACGVAPSTWWSGWWRRGVCAAEVGGAAAHLRLHL